MRAVVAAVLALGLAAPAARGQVPRTVSPRLARAWARPDTSLLVWIIADRGADLDSVAAAVRDAGGVVRHRSRFVWAVSARVPGSALRRLARTRGVRRIQALGAYYRRPEPTGPGLRAPGAGPGTCAGPSCAAAARAGTGNTTYGPGAWADAMLNVPAVHALGDSGQGVRVAMLDAGFNTAQPYLAGARVVAQRDYVNLPDTAGRAHGTATWSLIAARAPGVLVGVAPAAEFVLATTEYTPTETRVEEDNWVAAVEAAESLSVNIISSSLGYLSFDNGFSYSPQQLNGDVAVTTVAADSAAARGTLVVVSVGNRGPGAGTLETPADARNVVAVGAVNALGVVPDFSSRGPTADGRIKPEVVAPGLDVTVAAPDSGLALLSGTSVATPLVAGIAALVQGTRPGMPASELRRGLLDASGMREAPDNVAGWGIPDALKLLAFPTGLEPVGPLDSLTSLTPVFTWDAGAPPAGTAPDTFRLEVARDSGFVTVLLDTTVMASTVRLPFAPPPLSRLFWRVTARSALGTSERTRGVGPLLVPPWVTLVSLNAPSGESIRDSQPLFVWRSPSVTSPPGPPRYDVSVYPASEGPGSAVIARRGLTDTTFRPNAPLEKNLPFRWQVVVHLGTADSSVVRSTGTFLVLDEAAPATTILFQNFPNPFPNRSLGVTSSCIWFDVATPGEVRLEIFDLEGRLVRRLVPSDQVPSHLEAGRYGRPGGNALGTCDPRFAWDGRDQTGAFVRPGVYLYRLLAPGFRDTKRIVFLGAP